MLEAQVKTKRGNYSQSTIEQKMEEARSLKKSNPTKAIEILEGVFGQAKRRKDPFLESEAYFLLGEIYRDIEQNELALQRFENAFRLIEKSGSADLKMTHLVNLGEVAYDLKSYSKSRIYFQQCVDFKIENAIKIRCQEGLADVAITERKFSQGYAYNLDIQQSPNVQNDSLVQSKVYARNAEIYANQNQQSRANEEFYNSIRNLPQQKISKKDYTSLKNAKEAINSNISSFSEQNELNINVLEKLPIKSIPVNSLVEEQLIIADNYIKLDSLTLAAKYLSAAEKAIKPEVSAEKKAEVFKKSSEVNFKQGAYEAALSDYQKYTEQKDKIIVEKEQELTALIAILKGQEKIDLLAKDVELEEKEADLMQQELFTQRIIIGLLGMLLLAALAAFYFILKNVKARRKANQLLLLKSLRTQMNPHFIFNALNSVNNFIAKNDERAANKFLTDFSKLMRLVLNHSQKDFIALEEELHLIELYLKLEHLRFRDKFEYDFDKKKLSAMTSLNIPPMLIQPFIENAIWHGLRYKTEKGKLEVTVFEEENQVLIQIKDDGIGRKKSIALKTANQKNYQSEGMKNVGKRVALINDIYGKNYEIEVKDLRKNQEETGTFVEMKIPKN